MDTLKPNQLAWCRQKYMLNTENVFVEMETRKERARQGTEETRRMAGKAYLDYLDSRGMQS